jgi:transcriptional regulator with XRE-family HTH domain
MVACVKLLHLLVNHRISFKQYMRCICLTRLWANNILYSRLKCFWRPIEQSEQWLQPNAQNVQIGLNTMTLSIGPLAKRVRLEMGLKQIEVAQHIGTSTSHLGHFEQGQRRLSPLLLNRLMTLLHTNLETLTIISSSTHQSEDIDLTSPNTIEAQMQGWKELLHIVGVNNSPH